jgi:hypothetical protein
MSTSPSPVPPIETPLLERLTSMRHGLTFASCLSECARDPELIANYDRLRGTNLSLKGSGLSLEIDRVTGRVDSELRGFIDFCWESVFLRLG